jgi:hypothetical protein
MKKIVLTLVVLLLASPAWAADVVVITAAQVGVTNEVVISYDATGSSVLPRAFSLNIQLDDSATIVGVANVNPDFPIHPGTINIDLSGPEPSIDYGTPVAPQADLPSDTLPGLDSNGITIEMGSLYAPTTPSSPNAPNDTGVLLSIILDPPVDGNDTQTCLTFTGNVARAGSKGVVLEDPALDPTVTVPGPGTVCVTFPSPGPKCWQFLTQCHGDTNDDGTVNTTDFFALKDSWMKSDPDLLYNPCADFNRDGSVNTTDFFKLKDNWMTSPPADCPTGP